MNCMKCGREVGQDQAFCQDCLAEMEKYPVKPGAVVQLPAQSVESTPKKQTHRRPVLSAEEQIQLLKRRNRGLILALLLTAVLMAFFALATFKLIEDNYPLKIVGQNYSTVEETETSSGTTP